MAAEPIVSVAPAAEEQQEKIEEVIFQDETETENELYETEKYLEYLEEEPLEDSEIEQKLLEKDDVDEQREDTLEENQSEEEEQLTEEKDSTLFSTPAFQASSLIQYIDEETSAPADYGYSLAGVTEDTIFSANFNDYVNRDYYDPNHNENIFYKEINATTRKDYWNVTYKNAGKILTDQGLEKSIDLQVTLEDYTGVHRVTKDGKSTEKAVVGFRKDKIAFFVAGVESVTFRYDFFVDGKKVNLKGYGTLLDLDACQGFTFTPTNIEAVYLREGNTFLKASGNTIQSGEESIGTEDERGWSTLLFNGSFSVAFTSQPNSETKEGYWKYSPDSSGFLVSAFFEFSAKALLSFDDPELQKRVGPKGCDWDEAKEYGKADSSAYDFEERNAKRLQEFDYLLYSELFPQLHMNQYTVTDTLESCLEIDGPEKVTVTDQFGDNVTKNFDIKVEEVNGKYKIVCAATKEAMQDRDFSAGKKYTFHFTVHRRNVKPEDEEEVLAPWISEKETNEDQYTFYIPNDAELLFQRDGEELKRIDSNQVWIRGEVQKVHNYVRIQKTDAETQKPLPGAEFILYEWNKTKGSWEKRSQLSYNPDSKEYYSERFDATKENEGRFKVEETKAPEGYILESWSQEFRLDFGESKDLFYTLTNTPQKGMIRLQKLNKETGDQKIQGESSLKGAEYGVYDQKGTLIDMIKTDQGGKGQSKELPLGSYQVREIKASPGFGLDTNLYSVTLESNDDTTPVFVKSITSLEPPLYCDIILTKKIKAEDINWNNGNPIFTFKLEQENGEKIIRHQYVEFTEEYVKKHTDMEGYVSLSVSFSKLPIGKYRAKELSVMRYQFKKIENVEHGTIQGKEIQFVLSGEEVGKGTFLNEKYEWQDYSDSSIVSNHFGKK